jgi:hypothetical protein
MSIPQISIYETNAISIAMTGDALKAVLTFKPHNGLPVSVYLSRHAFERFLEKASEELSR